jgi:hypothetical protein
MGAYGALAPIALPLARQITPGFPFGTDGNRGSQVRGVLEIDILL